MDDLTSEIELLEAICAVDSRTLEGADGTVRVAPKPMTGKLDMNQSASEGRIIRLDDGNVQE